MLPRPGLLHIFVVHIDVIRFVTQFLQVVGVKEWLTKEALTTHPHLFRIRSYFQPRVLSVEPTYERRIIPSEDQESDKFLSTRDDATGGDTVRRRATCRR